jgi:hypothetical protein
MRLDGRGYGSFLEAMNQIRARLEILTPLVFSRDAFLLSR